MPNVNRSALVPYSALQMFDLVNDVNQYPKFLPGCTDAKVLTHQEDMMEASLLVSKAGVKQWFTTRNELLPGKKIMMALKDGPFKQLQGGWTFTELDTHACKIELNLDFEFSSKVVEMAFGKVFNSIVAAMVKAFTERAKEVYSD